MVNAYAVIGANYGDEGKGLVTNYLCRKALSNNHTVINVLTNGGCQRGHTAYDKNGFRHVYSHFGSGYPYADIYFSKFYMVNPMIFFDEYHVLKNNLDKLNNIYIDENCTITTPYDMLVNRMIENRRTHRHGSCGYGIWETVCRNKKHPLYWKDLLFKSHFEIVNILKSLRNNYFQIVIANYGIELTEEEKELFFSENLVLTYAQDIIVMQSLVNTRTIQSILNNYDVVVFENAQGLLLDKDYDEWGTPTKTGMAYIKELVPDGNVIPYYVTRSYLTKHGNGYFPGECDKKDINPDIIDITNHPNEYQGTLRYGNFDETLAYDLLNRVKEDAAGYEYRIVVTHINEYWTPYLNFANYVSDNETDLKVYKKDGMAR